MANRNALVNFQWKPCKPKQLTDCVSEFVYIQLHVEDLRRAQWLNLKLLSPVQLTKYNLQSVCEETG